MRSTTQNYSAGKIAVTMPELMDMCSCGRTCAEMLAEAAGARITIGRRVLFNVSKIQRYLDEHADISAKDGEAPCT